MELDPCSHVGYDHVEVSSVAFDLENQDFGWVSDDDSVNNEEPVLNDKAIRDALSDGMTPELEEEVLYDGNTRSVEEWRRMIFNLDEEPFARKDYFEGTESMMRTIENHWNRFFYCFLDWLICQKKSEDGRPRPGIRKKSTLITTWCAFRLVFERATKQKIDKFVDSQKLRNVNVLKGIVNLAKVHGLSHEKRDNRSMTLEDLKLQLDTTIRTTEKSFKLGEQRILAVLFLLLLAPAGSRPQSILQMRFGDIKVALRRDPFDPENGPIRLLLRLTLQFTKKYLGPKAMKTFYILEMICEPNFIFNPHVFLLGILFKNRVFRAEGLNNNPQMLVKMRIYDGEPELRLPFKDDMLDVPVFRRAIQDSYGLKMGREPIGYSIMSSWVRRIGELVGFERNTISYSLRYMAGNGLDQNENVSESLRNLILDHAPNSDTFQKHYLSRNVYVDLWAVHIGHTPQHVLVQQSTSHGSSRSSRRPVYLTQEQSESINQNPRVIRLQEILNQIPQRSARYSKARLELLAAKRRVRNSIRNDVRKVWTENQAVEDIERQIQGLDFAPSASLRPVRPMSVRQKELVDVLTVSLICDLPTQRQRRTDAINAIVDYCAVKEPLVTKVTETRQPNVPVELRQQDPKERLRQSVMVGANGERPRRCFICVGKALTLPLNDPNITHFCRSYHSFREVTRHFRSQHLSKLGDDDRTNCPICPGVTLIHKKHLKRHADDVHGIATEGRGWHGGYLP
ncbi:C2H2 finger domain-containing protein [Nemania sp. FL0031]|nr:C2H2 finger domain-containing protein [Nemania sp. FL0031]